MAAIRFSWDNLIWRSGVVFTGGTPDADWPLANLAEYHPSKKTRLTAMANSYVLVQFPRPEVFDTVAVLDHTASPHRNLLQYSSEVTENPTEWPLTNCTIATTSITDPSLPARVEKFRNATAGSLVRYVQNSRVIASYTTDRASASAQQFVAECYFQQVAADQHASLTVVGASGNATANINLNDGTADSESASGNFSALTTTITASGTFYKVVMVFTVAAAETDFNFRIQALNAAFATTFDSTANWFYFSAPMIFLGSASQRYDQTLSGASGGLWRVKRNALTMTPATGSNDDSGWLNMAQSSNPRPLSDALGSLSCYAILSQRSVWYMLVELHDGDNVVTDIDIGALWAGQSWQPTGSLQPGWQLFVDRSTGMLNLSGSLLYMTAADYYADAVALALNARVGSRPRQRPQISIGGQEFRADSKPALCIVDSDEADAEYGQQQMVYGFVEKWKLFHMAGPSQFGVKFLIRGLRA